MGYPIYETPHIDNAVILHHHIHPFTSHCTLLHCYTSLEEWRSETSFVIKLQRFVKRRSWLILIQSICVRHLNLVWFNQLHSLPYFTILLWQRFKIGLLSIWLVVDLPLWKIRVRQLGWWHSQYDGKNNPNVPNHQPVISISHYIPLYPIISHYIPLKTPLYSICIYIYMWVDYPYHLVMVCYSEFPRLWIPRLLRAIFRQGAALLLREVRKSHPDPPPHEIA